jgi:Flp pilus assembly protein TadD
LSGVYLPPPWRLFYSPFGDREPTAVIGNSIRVYWVDRWPETRSPSSSFDGATHGVLAQLLLGLNWFDHAALHYRQYLESHPDDVGALGNLGIALLQSGETEEAVRNFRLAAHVSPRNTVAQENLARALLEHGDATEAAVYAQRAVTMSPSEPAPHVLFGRTLAAQGRAADAIAQFAGVLEVDPVHAEAREHLCHVLSVFSHARFRDQLSPKYCSDRISPSQPLP